MTQRKNEGCVYMGLEDVFHRNNTDIDIGLTYITIFVKNYLSAYGNNGQLINLQVPRPFEW